MPDDLERNDSSWVKVVRLATPAGVIAILIAVFNIGGTLAGIQNQIVNANIGVRRNCEVSATTIHEIRGTIALSLRQPGITPKKRFKIQSALQGFPPVKCKINP